MKYNDTFDVILCLELHNIWYHMGLQMTDYLGLSLLFFFYVLTIKDVGAHYAFSHFSLPVARKFLTSYRTLSLHLLMHHNISLVAMSGRHNHQGFLQITEYVLKKEIFILVKLPK